MAGSNICRIKAKIRKAVSADAPVIADFNGRMAWETEKRRLEPDRVLAGVRALLKQPTRGHYFVAVAPGNPRPVVAGQLLITYEWSDWRNGNFWWIQSVFVPEQFRGQGVFRSLYAHIRQLAKKRKDVCGLRLYVEAGNRSAQRAYEKLGMHQTDYRMFELDFVLRRQNGH